MRPIAASRFDLSGAILCILLLSLILFSCKKEHSCENCLPGNGSVNKPPVANAGKDTIIILPTDSVILDGSQSFDPDGSIVNYLWTKISGPGSFSLNNAASVSTLTKNLVAGSYQFELKVKDNGDLFSRDTVRVTVDAAPATNHPPVALAGPDQTIYLPVNSTNLNGNGSYDIENNIVSYEWRLVNLSSANIVNPNQVQTLLDNLVQGTYPVELKVTDAGGLFSTDTVIINVTQALGCPVFLPVVQTQETVLKLLTGPTRDGITLATAGTKILFAGGVDPNDGFGTTQVDIYDTVTRVWTTGQLSVPRWDMEAVTVGSKIYFAGGHTLSQNAWANFATVDIYDAASDTWSTIQLSERRMFLAATAVGNTIFFAGGLGGDGNAPPSTVSNKVDIYNIATNSWGSKTLSQGRAGLSAVTSGNEAFFAGGNMLNASYTQSCFSCNRLDIVNVLTSNWSVSNISYNVANQAAISVNGKIYWAGGATVNCSPVNSNLSDQVQIYDVATRTSTYACLSQPNARFRALLCQGRIVFFVGEAYHKDEFDIYDPATNTWSIGRLNTPISGNCTLSVISVNNKLYVANSNQISVIQF